MELQSEKYINLQNYAKRQLKKILDCAADITFPDRKNLDFLIEVPADFSHGDFASNIAMVAAKIFKKSPVEIFKILCKNIDLSNSYFEKFELAGPGFLNFFLTRQWFKDVIVNVLNESDCYGRLDFGNGKKVLVEFVSANPTGPMHIGNARGGALGDCLAQLLAFAGFSVQREFYVNDAGNQIEKFKKSLALRYEQVCYGTENFTMPQDCYLGTDILDHAKNYFKEHGDSLLSLSEKERMDKLCSFALPLNIEGLKKDLLAYGIRYDSWFFESELHFSNKILEIIDRLDENGFVYRKNGAVWFNYTKLGGEKDEVLIRENKIPTYFAADIAYHYNKLVDRGFDVAIDVWGADHHGHIARLKGALSAIGLDASRLNVVLMQMVRLIKGNETVKISKRSGIAITLSDLLEDISVDAARFFFNMREPNSHFDFDLDLAVEQSLKNPVYYVQHAHARIFNILKKLEAMGYLPSKDAPFELLKEREEVDLVRVIATFPEEVLQAAKSYDPSRITKFLINIATKFQQFYSNYRVKGADEEILMARLGLCKATLIAIKNALDILKIEALEEF